MENFDIAIIGGGPGGYVAAIRAAQLGKKVVLIEKESLGGVCLNWGCIPTKSLLKSAEIFQTVKHAQEYGILTEDPQFDIKKIVERSRNISLKLTTGIKALLRKNKVRIIEGSAKLLGNRSIEINNSSRKESISANNIIVATGARSKFLPGFEPDGLKTWTSKEAMKPESLPSSMIIVGSGAIGIEFASFYNALGTKVIVLESQERIVPAEDQEISTLARKAFEKRDIEIFTNIKLVKRSYAQDRVVVDVEIEGKIQSLQADKLLMAVGIVGNIEDIGLENTKIEIERGHIVTNKLMQTSEPNVYAIGDVTGAPWLAHKASHEGIIAVEIICGLHTHQVDITNIPGCTYSLPQIASVGMTEAAAKAAGLEIKVGRFPFTANGKALVLGEPEGLIKTIFDSKTGELLGAHMIGVEVTELIQGYVIAKNLETTELDLMRVIFPHPTLSEMMHESVLQAYGKEIHI